MSRLEEIKARVLERIDTDEEIAEGALMEGIAAVIEEATRESHIPDRKSVV